MKYPHKFIGLLTLVLSFTTQASSLESWMKKQEAASWQKLLANLSPAGARTGAVIASPQRHNPDYFFHWVRDAALVMDVVMAEQRHRPNAVLAQHIDHYIDFSLFIQEQHTLTNLGEPKYHADGLAFNGPWGRPQNDSPALRALYLVRHTQFLLKNGTSRSRLGHLYTAEIPAHSLIKRDLEYVAHHWDEAGFDLWEEVKGDHFYTLLVTREALREGADLANTFQDKGAAAFYSWQASLVESRLKDFVHNNHFVTMLDQVEGLNYKHSNLDTSILLGVLHAGDNAWVRITDSRLNRTMTLLEEAFNRVYPLNQRGLAATALGRYPEDQYYGGNPWILTTLAMAEYHYKLAQALNQKRHIELGDAYVERVRFHARQDGAMAEQWDRHTGYHISADELTWSHAAFITAMRERREAKLQLSR